MALLLKQKRVWGIIIGTNYKPIVPDTDATPSQLEKYSDWVDLHGIARSAIFLGIEPQSQIGRRRVAAVCPAGLIALIHRPSPQPKLQ